MRVLLSLCLALLLAGTADASAQAWSEYRPAGAGFRIEMPGTPEVKRTNVVSLDRTEVMLTRAQASVGPAAYVISWVDLAKGALPADAAGQVLQTVRDGNVAGNPLKSDRPLTVAGGHPAREYVYDRGDGTIGVSRIIVVGGRLYNVAVNMAGGTADRPLTRRFIDSFQLTGP
jgi:hypothetical protein